MNRDVRVIIPFKYNGAKSRLAPVLSYGERSLFSIAMLLDVIDTTSYLEDVTILTRPQDKTSAIPKTSSIFEDLDSPKSTSDIITTPLDRCQFSYRSTGLKHDLERFDTYLSWVRSDDPTSVGSDGRTSMRSDDPLSMRSDSPTSMISDLDYLSNVKRSSGFRCHEIHDQNIDGQNQVLSSSSRDERSFKPLSFSTVESNLDLNDAINQVISLNEESKWDRDIMIVMADLALITKSDIEGLIETKADVVLSPGRGGGTNMILIRNSKFRTRYEGLSFPKHVELCRSIGLTATTFSTHRTVCDIDEPDDLPEVFLHGHGRSLETLKRLGFVLKDVSGRALCARDETNP